jgi:hypothetical protein
MMLRRTSPMLRFLVRSLIALALVMAPIPMGVATAIEMPAKTAMQSGADGDCSCEKGNADCAKSETCFVKCTAAPALEPKRFDFQFFATAAIEEHNPSQLDSLLAPPPHPPPRA